VVKTWRKVDADLFDAFVRLIRADGFQVGA
jgi:hypothetical protein